MKGNRRYRNWWLLKIVTIVHDFRVIEASLGLRLNLNCRVVMGNALATRYCAHYGLTQLCVKRQLLFDNLIHSARDPDPMRH